MSIEDETLTQDVVFDILSSARRRYVLYLLRTEDAPVELTELAEDVAAWENDTTVDELTKQQRKRVYVSLYQTHVPKLEDAGLVNYDQDTGEVELTQAANDVDQYLNPGEREVPWQYLYLPLAILGIALVALTNLNVWIFANMTDATLGVIIFSGFLLTVGAHIVVWTMNRRQVPDDLRRQT
ncbi:hypothetical protein ACFQMA_04210 [Halosimplex aquaticum]|uniref:DUF7344 domain-containing protein n=1 Tax=Halosimplex aquaticum TaxID=3026162 RepID=A0ABD5XYI5_9EURY|nr:hypothetical protein [Halosimplex aquaticum]